MFHISKGCFSPRPKVDSSFLRLTVRDTPAVTVRDEKLLFRIIRAAFNQRRKTLKNSLKNMVPEDKMAAFFYEAALSDRIRPEQLSLADFAQLTNLL